MKAHEEGQATAQVLVVSCLYPVESTQKTLPAVTFNVEQAQKAVPETFTVQVGVPPAAIIAEFGAVTYALVQRLV